MSSAYTRIVANDPSGKRLLLRNPPGTTPACCTIENRGKVSCDRYKDIPEKVFKELCVQCQAMLYYGVMGVEQ